MDPLRDEPAQSDALQDPPTPKRVIEILDTDVVDTPLPPSMAQYDALVESLLAQEALRMTEGGRIPDAAPGPSPGLSGNVHAAYAATVAVLKDRAPISFTLARDLQHGYLTKTLVWDGHPGSKNPGLFLVEGTHRVLWSECHDQDLLDNQRGLLELETLATDLNIRSSLRLAVSETEAIKRTGH